VLAFHGGVGWLSGGFLGVDAFFVLSGFLITSLLLAEHRRAGRIRLVAFWGRRARRLLPALLVLLVTVVATAPWLLPPTEITMLRADALGALGYVANWRMIFRGTGYFEQTAAPSMLQHTWSLGIEEQFYLCWPLLILALLRLARWRRVLLAVCAIGVVGSVVEAALLYQPYDVNRAYFGTDTRAGALLIGCGLAALLGGGALPGGRHRASGPAERHRVLGGFALLAVVALGWAWSHADGTSGWLYFGGFAGLGLAAAAVIGHAVRSPGSPTAWLLRRPPLVWLGKISYGTYLWHWPVFLVLNGDRTGLTGPALLVLRCLVTLGIATVSYHLVERPIRRRALLPAPRLATATALAAVAATAGFTLVATAVPQPPPSHAVAVAPPKSRVAAPSPKPVSPMHRPGRRHGKLPRVTIFGDSVSWSLGAYLPAHPGLAVSNRGVQGCGISPVRDIRYIGFLHHPYPGCDHWATRWHHGMLRDDPDVAVILLDRWELMDAKPHGAWVHVGQPPYDAWLAGQLRKAISVVGERGAAVVLLTAPYTHRMERPDGGLFPEDTPARADAWNRLLRRVAAEEGTQVLDLNRVICPDGRFTWAIDGMQVRSDGLHFTPAGVQRVIAPWLLPQLARIAASGRE
jgi:peptidoglycan/LPS O-acetylase OafA/YrhL